MGVVERGRERLAGPHGVASCQLCVCCLCVFKHACVLCVAVHKWVWLREGERELMAPMVWHHVSCVGVVCVCLSVHVCCVWLCINGCV